MSKRTAAAKQRRAEEHRLPVESIAAAVAESHAAERRAMIANAAYLRAERRGFEPGHELEDWLAAELEVTNMQRREASAAFPD